MTAVAADVSGDGDGAYRSCSIADSRVMYAVGDCLFTISHSIVSISQFPVCSIQSTMSAVEANREPHSGVEQGCEVKMG